MGRADVDVRGLQRRCDQLLLTLDLRPPFDVNEFCRKIGERLGRQIELVPQRLPAEIPGRCIWFADRLVIAYEEDTSLFHQLSIIFHELGHVLLQHDFSQTLEAIPLRVSLDAEGIRHSLARSGYESVPEQEAEFFASLLLQRVAPNPIRATRYRSQDPRAAQIQDFMSGLP